MVQGASSSVGKSLMVTALCRIFARRGVRVAPFKAQNMSNNAAVCADGGEIGRSQALQALASGIEPVVDMNPVLLKPEADHRSQVVVRGRPWHTLSAGQYYDRKKTLWAVVTESLDRLRSLYDLVIIEGAGSPAELNLQASDMVNMAVARYAEAPVVLVGDIDRGGVFAQLLGTLWLLPEEERRLVRGLIVNKFRGDPALFYDGVAILEERSTLPVLGVVPYLPGLGLPEEDAATLSAVGYGHSPDDALDIAVVRLPHIANFDDFNPLQSEPGVRVRFVESVDSLGRPDAVILPGSKSTVADLGWLRTTGLHNRIGELARDGINVVGICGGYQMLGRTILDPACVESDRPETDGLALLPVATTFATVKLTHRVRARIVGGPGWMVTLAGHELAGYEIHSGRSTIADVHPWLAIAREGEGCGEAPDGAATVDGSIWGCYVHGLFDDDRFRRAWLDSLASRRRGRRALSPAPTEMPGYRERFRLALDRLADEVEGAVDIEALVEIIKK
ncbi:cobyric acid synthase [Singulisphaera sp. PoT]|uniref:cobyric acid synthase n=1 Tax=Singulisphaera sp. PoT TaxID=3411797 RepID=UPI003BF60FEF